ncbi:UNVERIFIED_CONTAM: hypothetical protein Sangu_0987900 [Sesamum angustifolium]|uniref:Uncharacterized protein n=1 Tax=Sesamum angustifolium TaxID=2727405 RepID=A0AAW2PHG8_9LAMI
MKLKAKWRFLNGENEFPVLRRELLDSIDFDDLSWESATATCDWRWTRKFLLILSWCRARTEVKFSPARIGRKNTPRKQETVAASSVSVLVLFGPRSGYSSSPIQERRL